MNKYGKIFVERNICPGPFTRLNIARNGNVYSCVTNYVKKIIPVGNILENTLDEIWNGEPIKELRKIAYEGRYDEICRPNCPRLIALKNKRMGLGKYATRETFKQVKKRKIHIDSPYLYMCVANDPSCNLACIMCREKRISRPTEKEERINKAAFEELYKNISKIKVLRFTGNGELFFKKSAIEFLKKLKNQDTSHLTLHITTNAQLLDQSNWEMLNRLKVKRIEMGVSIDAATKQTYEKIRLHANWERLQKNMNMLLEERAKGNLHYLIIHFVVLKSNIDEIPQFVKMGEEWNCDAINFSRAFDNKAGARENFFIPPDPVYLEKLSQILKNPELHKPYIWINQLSSIQSKEKLQ